MKVLNEAARSQEAIVIRKRGKRLAQVVPYRKSVMKPTPGKLADAFVFENDIMSEIKGIQNLSLQRMGRSAAAFG